MGKYFDNLCRWAEALPHEETQLIRNIIRTTALFEVVDYRTMNVYKTNSYSKEEIEILGENFHLPFQNTACEDNDSCVVLHDVVKNQEGMKCQRSVIISTFAEPEHYPIVVTAMIDSIEISSNRVGIMLMDSGFDKSGEECFVTTVSVCSEKKKWTRIDEHPASNFMQMTKKNIVEHIITFINEIMFSNVPSKFILKSEPIDKLMMETKKLPRTHQRPVFTILKPNEIRQRMMLGDSDVTHSSPRIHERRGHFRILRDERYKRLPDGDFKKIWIPACWVGKSENIVGNRKYTVILD